MWLLALVLLLPACSSGPGPAATPTTAPAATIRPTGTALPTSTAVPMPTRVPTRPPTRTPQSTPTETPSPTAPPTSTPSPTPTDTPQATATLRATNTPWPTSTPWAGPGASGISAIAVCAEGCDFTSLQAEIDDTGTLAGAVLYVADAVHTESGITVHKDVTIQGRGAGYTIVQAHERADKATDRVFHVVEGVTVTFRAMTIRHGHPRAGIRSGGGILNNGTLTLSHCVVRDNRSNCGGGILTVRGVLVMTHCTVRDNWADGEGEPGFECGSGGAIKLEDESEATLQNCTLAGNQAEGKGGGLHVSCTSAATLTNCTVSGNKALGRGGGVNAKGTLTLVHCTIQGNSARGIVRGKRLGEQAGGGLSAGGRGILHVSNTLIANNPKDGDCTLGEQVTVGTNAYNLVEDGSCKPAFSGDPGLLRLGDYGGDTHTHGLRPGSPALDAIPAQACTVDVDQRGMPRPGDKEATDETCDVGAFELVAR